MTECDTTKSLLKAIMIVKTKGRQVRCIAQRRGVLRCLKQQKNMLVDKISLSKKINSNKKDRKCVAFLMGGEDWLNVNRPAKNTLVLIKFR